MLEALKISWTESVRLGNDGNQVDSGAKTLHDFDIQRLQRVSGWANEVQAGVDAEINAVNATRLLLLKHVGFVLIVEELDDRLPRVAVVDIVAKPGSINDSQADYLPTQYMLLQSSSREIPPLKNFSSNSAFVISISTVLSTCLAWRRR